VRPTRRLYLALLGWTAAGGAAVAWPACEPAWWGLGGLLGLLALGEAWLLRRTPLPEVSRVAPHSLAVGTSNRFGLRLRNLAPRALEVRVHDHHPEGCEVEGLPVALRLPAGGWAQAAYDLRPRRRGAASFGGAALLVRGRLGLLDRAARVPLPAELKVYPDFKEVVRYALLALADRLGQMGIRKSHRRGEGLEFEQLRDYRQGDLLRQIDWKATARRRRLTSREYEEEKNQQVVFLVDCGRRLRARDGELAHFDHVLNAVLLLTYVALRQGDAVGFMTFSGDERWVAPVKGPAAMVRILEELHDLETSLAPSDFAEAARRLLARQRRRALVVLVTNLREEDSPELRPALAALARRHLVLLASLREAALRELCEAPVRGLSDALGVAEAFRYARERRAVHEGARQGGALVLDVEPAELPVSLVNRYLDVKRTGRL
jgi:uncharacterized protein (DUF58 family)